MIQVIAILVISIQFIANAAAGNQCGVVPITKWSGELSRRTEVLDTPVNLVVIQHTASASCHTESSCERLLRNIRDYLMNQLNYIDIGQSFLVGDDGKVYEGAGWNRVGAHTRGYNNKSIAISFLGNFSYSLPSPEALQAAQRLLECGMKNNFLTENYNLVGHRQLTPTLSPGDKLQNLIKTWPHWTNVTQVDI